MKVISKQKNSKLCYVCGVNNNEGLHAPFYNMEDGSVATILTFKPHHQSYPGRVHGGILSTLLDELMGRVIWVTRPNDFAVTMTMSVKFRKPVTYNTEIKAIAFFDKESSRIYNAIGKIYDKNNTLLCEATGTYFKMTTKQIETNEEIDMSEFVDIETTDPTEIDFPSYK